MSLRTAIFISGGGSNMVALVESMTGDHPARPCLVLSNRPDAGGLDKARERAIATAVVDHRPFGRDRLSFENALQQVLRAHDVQIICLAGFMRVLTAGFVQQWQGRILNIHPSLLPRYPGLDTHARALAAGDAEAGCSVHLVTPVLDEGPLLGQASVAVLPGDTPESLAARVLEREHQLYPQCFKSYCEKYTAGSVA